MTDDIFPVPPGDDIIAVSSHASAAYIVLEAEWVYSGQGAVAGTLRNVGWTAVEIGRTGGAALVIVALLRDFQRIGDGVRCDPRDR